MRPITLTIQAFGSYGKKTVIDFTSPSQNLFLITGDTGAGKTTIFDAMVFALYGEASSSANKKEGAELQSQFAAPDVEPYAELCFTERRGGAEEVYTVRRSPRHTRPKIRGEGFIDVVEKVSLTMPDGSEYPPKETDGKLEEIIGLTKAQFMQVAMIAQGEFMELLRAKSDEKKAIFRRLFGTGIYQDIIGETGRLRKESRVKLAEIRTLCQGDAARIRVQPEDASAGEVAYWQKRLISSDRLAVTDLEGLTSSLQKLCEGLAVREEELSSRHKAAEEAYLKARDAYTDGLHMARQYQAMREAEADQKALEEEAGANEEAKKRLAAIQAAKEIQAFFRQFEESARALDKTKETLADLKASLPGLLEEEEKEESRRRSAGDEKAKALDAYARAEQQVEAALGALKKAEALKQVIVGLEKEQTQAMASLKKEKESLSALEEQEAAWKEKEEVFRDAPVAIERWERTGERLKNLEKSLSEAEKAGREASLQEKRSEEATAAYRAAREVYEKRNAAAEELRRAFFNAQAGLLAREELREGEPCPVCGSLTHPRPCVLAEDVRSLRREDVEESLKEVRALSEAQEKAAEKAHTENERLLSRQEAFREAVCRLGEAFGSREESEPEIAEGAAGTRPEIAEGAAGMRPEIAEGAAGTWPEIAERVAGTRPEIAEGAAGTRPEIAEGAAGMRPEIAEGLDGIRPKTAAGAAGTLPDTVVRARAEDLTDDRMSALASLVRETLGAETLHLPVKEIKAALKDMKNAHASRGERLKEQAEILSRAQEFLKNADDLKKACRERIEKAEAIFRETASSLIARRTEDEALKRTLSFENAAEAEGFLANAAKQRDSKEKAEREAVVSYEKAHSSRVQCEALISRCQGDLPEQEKDKEKKKADYTAALNDKAMTEEEYLAVVKSLSPREEEKLKKSLEDYQSRIIRAKAAKEAALKAIGERQEPDTEVLLSERECLAAALKEVEKTWHEVRERLKEDSSLCTSLADKLAERGEAILITQRLDDLYNRLAGQATGARMDIETYAQRTYLKHILVAANKRFREMSAGQFELRMVELSQAGEGKNHGLDLMVYSALTGKEREVRTLSGGESFMAALSMALGLADEIQANRSALNLDMMFIDEGFGSLDEHARTQAVRVLKEMAGSERLIGIISHVTELKQEIEEQLCVTRDERGSHAKWS